MNSVRTQDGSARRANRGIRNIVRVISTGRMARPMMLARPRGLEKVDRLYYVAANVDKSTVDRFYGFTLRKPRPRCPPAARPHLAFGQFESADRSVDYFGELGRVMTSRS